MPNKAVRGDRKNLVDETSIPVIPTFDPISITTPLVIGATLIAAMFLLLAMLYYRVLPNAGVGLV